MNKAYLFIILLGWATLLQAQKSSGLFEYKSVDLQVNYGLQVPVGVLAERFGFNASLGGKVDYRWPNSKLLIGLDGIYIFGSKVKEDVVSPIYNKDYIIYGAGGLPALIFLRERGFNIGAHVGRVWKIPSKKNWQGIRTTLGFGVLSHKIKVLDDTRSSLQFLAPYDAGYDRLTYGYSSRIDVGYQYFSSNNRINFYTGFHLILARTKNRRSWNFSPDKPIDKNLRWDSLMGWEFGWVIPFYFGKGHQDKLIYY